ncbi:MAG TPA: sensor histidine kinase, partial [Thermoanaerobaculia bacterium]|nr:sensor histidine kinase [Thermoanaerobaculia bacterium]
HLEILLKEAAGGASGPAVVPRLEELVGIASHALEDVRQVSRLLRPPMLNDLGLVPTLRWLARTIQEQTGLLVALDVEGVAERIDDADVETLVFRVVQEALTNVVKHAAARQAEVRLARNGSRVSFSVKDDGRGFEPERLLDGTDEPTGLGLRGMRDRVSLFGGNLEVRSAPGHGTVIAVEVPCGVTGAAEGAE